MLTVLMATHNGASTLERVLSSYEKIIPPEGGWKLVIVDNASTDLTEEIIRTYQKSLPLEYIKIHRRGKNVALNHGLKEIEGDIVIFTDDDGIADPTWLIDWRNTADTKREFSVFGGAIYPVWPSVPPEWIIRLVDLGATFAITDPDHKSGPTSAGWIWGVNMVVRSNIFEEGHRFNESVGPQAGQYTMGSEVDFVSRLEKIGHKLWFSNEIKVGHIIRKNQLEQQWIINRAFRLGKHRFHQDSALPSDGTPLFRGAPRWKYRLLLNEYLNLAKAIITNNTDNKFLSKWEIKFLTGYLNEANSTRKSNLSNLKC